MVHLELSLLGGFMARLDNQPVGGFVSDKARALLAYLAAEEDRPHRREALAALLWPEHPAAGARGNLSHALYNLRSILGDRSRADAPGEVPFMRISGEVVQFNPASDHRVDVTSFTCLLHECAVHAHRAQETCESCVRRLGEAVGLYQGSFLQELAIGDSVPFEEWAAIRREQLHRLAIEALQWLAATHEHRGEVERGLVHAWRQVELDPWREEGQRQLMRLLALSGQRSAALAQYEACRRALAEGLGVEPERETVTLYEEIRQGTLARPQPRTISMPPMPDVEEIPDAPQPLFVAREEELAQLDRWLSVALSGQGRVGFVVGEPGSGKTALVREFTRRAMEAHSDLVVAWGNGNAYSGLGDPYLPFLEILAMLTADIETQRAAGAIRREHARRLRGILPATVAALLDHGPGLVDLLIPGAGLLARAQGQANAGVRVQSETGWLVRLAELVSRKASGAGPGVVSQVDLFQQVTRVLQALAREHPLLLVLDDLQWADAGSIALLFHLGRRLAGSRILLLGAYRPEEVAQGRDGQPHPLVAMVAEFRRLWDRAALDLAQADGQRLLNGIVDSEPNRLGTLFREGLYRHTGGHALFTVELWRGLQERGDLQRDAAGYWVEGPELDWERLPARVEAAIASTVERLPAAWQELLTVASVEGEEFTAEVVARVLGSEEREVSRALSGPLSAEHRLVRAISLQRRGEQRLARYRFRHYLFQEYLYQRLDEVERSRLHEEVGLALEGLCGATPRAIMLEVDVGQRLTGEWMKLASPQWLKVAAVAPQLARHFQAAGLTERAVTYLAQAADRAYILSAYEEHVSQLGRALELLVTLPPTPARIRHECVLQTWLAIGLTEGRSYILPEVGRARTRAYELAQQLGDVPLLCEALLFLANNHHHRGELRLARDLGERAVHLAEGLEEPLPTTMHILLAGILITCGDFSGACAHLEPQIAAYLEPEPHPAGVRDLCPRRFLSRTTSVSWCLGYPDRALRVGRAALAVAHAVQDEYNILLVLCFGICFPHQLRREVGAVERALRELWPLVRKEASIPVFRPFAILYQGWVHAQTERLEQGIAELRQGLVEWSACDVVLRPHWRGYLAEALARAGRVEEGLRTLEEALEQVERTGERFNEAELHRLKGELLLQQNAPEAEVQAEACFQQAISVARGQEARSWELRTTMSLARLWLGRGQREEARQMLAAIYGWFTEGFDTPDLMEARALLEQLSADQAKAAV